MSLRKSTQKSVNPLDYERQPSAIGSTSKKSSFFSDSKTKSLTPEEKDMTFITDILTRLDEKNEKFPFSQISYNPK